jgi:hypothetical protein
MEMLTEKKYQVKTKAEEMSMFEFVAFYLWCDVQMIDGESCPGETSTPEGEGNADDDGRTALNHDSRKGHKQCLANIRAASEQLANLK